MKRFFNPKNGHCVGVYDPSRNFDKFTHFAVMDESTDELIASCGYFHDKGKKEIVADVEDYQHYFECIQQAKIYSLAPAMLTFIKELAEENGDAAEFLDYILNIKEPVERLLGTEALRVLDAMS